MTQLENETVSFAILSIDVRSISWKRNIVECESVQKQESTRSESAKETPHPIDTHPNRCHQRPYAYSSYAANQKKTGPRLYKNVNHKTKATHQS